MNDRLCPPTEASSGNATDRHRRSAGRRRTWPLQWLALMLYPARHRLAGTFAQPGPRGSLRLAVVSRGKRPGAKAA
jgi:hypothetical protein